MPWSELIAHLLSVRCRSLVCASSLLTHLFLCPRMHLHVRLCEMKVQIAAQNPSVLLGSDRGQSAICVGCEIRFLQNNANPFLGCSFLNGTQMNKGRILTRWGRCNRSHNTELRPFYMVVSFALRTFFRFLLQSVYHGIKSKPIQLAEECSEPSIMRGWLWKLGKSWALF